MATKASGSRIRRAVSRLLPLIVAMGFATGLGADSRAMTAGITQTSESGFTEGLQPVDATEVTGRGPEEVTCLLCSTVILGAGAASVFGLITVAGIFPEPVIACAAACVIAFT